MRGQEENISTILGILGATNAFEQFRDNTSPVFILISNSTIAKCFNLILAMFLIMKVQPLACTFLQHVKGSTDKNLKASSFQSIIFESF